MSLITSDAEYHALVAQKMDSLRDLPHDELLRLAAEAVVVRDHLKAELECMFSIGEDFQREALLGWKAAVDAPIRAMREIGRSGADAVHNQPGGSREKVAKIRAAWATGKYRSRAECAEKAGAELGMSYDAARRALRNTPDPA